MKDDKDNHSYSKDKHPDGSEEQHQGYFATGIIDLKKDHDISSGVEYIKIYKGYQKYHCRKGFHWDYESG